jgi:hypothetical protein
MTPQTATILNFAGAGVLAWIAHSIYVKVQVSNANKADLALHALPTIEQEYAAMNDKYNAPGKPFQTSGAARF